MNCKKTWTRSQQNAILLPSFVNHDLRQHQEHVYYEREMALFPITIEIIEERRIVYRLNYENRILQESISAKWASIRYTNTIIRENKRLISLHKSLPKMFSDVNPDELREQTDKLVAKFEKEKVELTIDQNREQLIRRLLDMPPDDRKVAMANHIDGADPAEILETLRRTGQLEDASKRARTQFIRACPIESCRGFLSQQWKCGLCNVSTCPKCNIPKIKSPRQANANQDTDTKEEEHVCNPDDVATAELLAKDTRPCPQCGTGIFKIDGCDQMWCTECHTAFNWRTGQLETGHVHNPHYFEYQRRMGTNVRNIMDIPCGGLAPDQYHGVLHHLIHIAMNPTSCTEREARGLKPISKEKRLSIRTKTIDYAVSIDYFANRVLPRYRPDAIQDNLELRVEYLTEQITKDEFKTALSREAKQFNKKIEIGQVVQTVVFGMSDILTRVVNLLRESNDDGSNMNYCDPDKIIELFSEIDNLIEYANECLEFICKQYKLTRVAIFIRDEIFGRQPGLYTARLRDEETPEGIKKILVQVKSM
jgi:hypothetical protein